MFKGAIAPASGASAGVLLVISSFVLTNPGGVLFSHTDCRLGQALGNFTVWDPNSVVASPYLGSETGTVDIWSVTPSGWISLWTGTNVTDGNVTAYIVGFENWTVFSRSNVSEPGLGGQSPCSSSVVGYHSLNPVVVGERSGGIGAWTIASGLVSDIGLPTGLNGSDLCEQVENSTNSSCGVGAQFDMNFVGASGEIDTCGTVLGQTLHIRSDAWPVTAPFRWGHRTYTVPLDTAGPDSQFYSNGSTSWYNYSFPANGGIWQYENVTQVSSTGAGLVFSYAPCPTSP